jgi:hypothetical protein
MNSLHATIDFSARFRTAQPYWVYYGYVWFAANNLVELKKKDFGKANSIDGV